MRVDTGGKSSKKNSSRITQRQRKPRGARQQELGRSVLKLKELSWETWQCCMCSRGHLQLKQRNSPSHQQRCRTESSSSFLSEVYQKIWQQLYYNTWEIKQMCITM